tara:strand:- start:101 stop:331 length:231 start_codon:yes stop_codon:yes gene_type:complete
MFEPEDFEVPLEKQLRLRVILDEIEHCTDVKVLQENLKNCTQTLLSYQHILAKVTERQLKEEIKLFAGIIDTTDEL